MPSVFDYELVVPEADIDGLGHANNLAYLRWMQAAALAHSAAQGWSADNYLALGAGWVVRSHHIEYLQSAQRGEAVRVRTWVANLRRVTSLRKYLISRISNGQVLAQGATDWAFIDYSTRQLKRVPERVSAAFEALGDDWKPA